MKKQMRWLLILILAIANKATYSRQQPNVRDSFRDIETTQRLLETRRQQEYIDEQLKYPLRNEIKEKEKSGLEIEDGKKYLFKSIKVEDSDLFKKKVDELINQYVNTEMGKAEIYELLTKLSNIYLVEGYVTTLVTLKSGNINTGELIYGVKEGKLREIKFMDRENSTLLDKAKLKLAFPLKKDDLLTTQGMDQGLENLNVGGYNHITEITPTEEYGYSDIIIEENYRATGFSMGMDNSGYKDKGRYKLNFNFLQDNILGLNDRLTLNYIERLTKKRDLDKEPNYDIGYSIPVGYWRIGYNYNLGDNYNTVISDLGRYRTDSKSKKQKLKVSRILSRGQYHKTTIHGGITYKDNYNNLNGTVLDVSTKKYASTSLGIDRSDRFLGGTIFGMLEYERGVPWFGAENDPSIRRNGDYKVEYNKLNFNFDWMRSFALKEQGFQYRMAVGGSYSNDRLLSANQFTMGDEYTVRGFKESSVAGNKGIYINNTLTYLGTPNLNKFLSMIKPFVGLDGGFSKDRDLDESDKILGFAIGARVNIENFNLGITYGIPLKRAFGMPKEGYPIYFNMNYNF